MDGYAAFLDVLKTAAAREPAAPKAATTFAGQKPKERLQGEALRTVQRNELEMWRNWKSGGMKPHDLEPLLKSLEPRIHKETYGYKSRYEIPTAAIDSKAMELVLKQLKTYDPGRGTALNTHLEYGFKKLQRYVQQHQNPIRITGDTIPALIGDFQRFKSGLHEDMGRAPTAQEMHDRLLLKDHPFDRLRKNLSLKNVKRLMKEVKRVDIMQGSEDSLVAQGSSPVVKNAILALKHDIKDPKEMLVYEHTFGIGGKPVLGTGQLAKKLGVGAPKVSQLKNAIKAKLDRFVGEEA